MGHFCRLGKDLLHDAGHVPILRAFAKRILVLTERFDQVQRVDPEDHKWQIHAVQDMEQNFDKTSDELNRRFLLRYLTRHGFKGNFNQMYEQYFRFISTWQFGCSLDDALIVALAECVHQ